MTGVRKDGVKPASLLTGTSVFLTFLTVFYYPAVSFVKKGAKYT